MNAVWSFLSALFFKLLIPFAAFMAGKEAEKKDETENNLEAMRDAKAIHDSIDNDPAKRKRVRDYFR